MSTPTFLSADQVAGYTAGLVDDAAVFPPGNAPMPAAVPAHREHRRAWYGDVVGPFLCPTSRVPELLEALGPGTDPVDLALVADEGVLGVQQARNLVLDDDRVQLVGIEIALPRDGDPAVFARSVLEMLAFAVPTAVEVPRVPGWEGALDVLAEDGAERAKLRTGGPSADWYPTETEVAAFVVACVARSVPFKLTAGLHHPVRRTAPVTGFEEHGFLNVLAGTAAALDGAGADEVAALLAVREPGPLVPVLAAADPVAVRRRFTSYGSCSVVEPVEDLLALGLLAQPQEG